MTDDKNPYAHLERVDLDAAQRETDAEAVKRLVAMSPLERDRELPEIAKALGAKVTTLRQEVEKATKSQKDTAAPQSIFNEVTPWHEPVEAGGLMQEIIETLSRFCSLPGHAPELIAVWILHAWAHEASDISPILLLTSPEKRCGKTTTVKVIASLSPRPMHSVNMSSAVMFRVIQNYRPTVFVDEGDTFLAENEELRGILNGGHDRESAVVWRVEGDGANRKETSFSVWAPKTLALIGRAPETIEDRAISVRLKRKQTSEQLEKFRHRKKAEFEPLRQKLARWAEDNIPTLSEMNPEIPDQLNDREQDNAEAVCAIADLAGGEWPERIRAALIGNAATATADEPESIGTLLVRDAWDVFAARSSDKLGTERLIELLCALDDAPWSTWRRGLPITGRSLKKLLEPYEIAPLRDKHGSYYRRSDFEDAHRRYVVSGTPEKSATSAILPPCHPSDTEKPNEINDRWQKWQGGRFSEGGRTSVTPEEEAPDQDETEAHMDAELNAMFGEDER